MSVSTVTPDRVPEPRQRAAGQRPGRALRGSGWRSQVPRITSIALGVLAVVCAVAAVSEVFSYHFQPVRAVINELIVAAPANLGYAALVAVLALAVAARKRLAWRVLVAYFVLQALIDGGVFTIITVFPPATTLHRNHPWVHWLTLAGVGVSVAALVVLWLSRDEFYARAQRASPVKAAGAFVGLTAVFILLGWGLVSLFPGSLHRGTDTLSYAAERVLFGAVRFDFTRVGRAPGLVNLWLGVLGAVAVLVALLVLFRSQRVNAALTPEEEVRLRQLLAASGERDSLGYFATRRDKEVIFSSTGKAAVTYKVIGSVSLASGDPIGDPEAWAPAIKAWLEQAREYAWTPAVMGASEEGALAFSRAGLQAFAIGDEAIVHVDRFSLDGRDMRQVRQAVSRVRRAGYTVRVRRHADIPPERMARIIELAAKWRDTETERGFSMALGRLGDPADGQCVLIEARDREGNEAALLSFAPWGSTGLSLDLMRRDRSRENGLIEFMVTELVAAAPALGVRRISLNFAAFRAVFEDGARVGAGPVLRLWRGTLLFLSRWFQMESLYRSNVKYRPEWVPRFLCFEDNHDLATVALTSVVAEGLLAVPNVRTLLRRGLAAPLLLPDEALPPVTSTPEAAPAGPGGGDEQSRVRLAKLERLRDNGTDPYPPAVPRTGDLASVCAAHPDLPPDTRTGDRVAVAGRVILLRDHGATCFATLRDWSGDLQLMLTAESVGAQALAAWRSEVDLGDQVSVTGEVVTTRRGSLAVLGSAWTLAAKCLHPLPDKHRGLTDPESRVRQRHLDLIVNPATRDLLRIRGAVLGALRATLAAHGFLEVETPILQPVHGGATARPFTTHHNAYDLPMYLRIAPELYLKRLAVGGVGRVYELGRAFRNEGVDATHNPEFTILEAYQAYTDYTGMRALARELVIAAATAAYGAPVLRRTGADGTVSELPLDGEWPAVTVHEAVSKALGSPIDAGTDGVALRALAAGAGVPLHPNWDAGQVVLELYERLVEPVTREPTFYLDFPTSVSPLTRQHRTDPRLAERWDLVGFGMELGTAYTELVDPVEQRRRLTAQSLRAAGGDAEAMELDEDFLAALEYGMPPTGGLGLGVDRLVMLLTGRSIRETLPFPTARPNTGVSH